MTIKTFTTTLLLAASFLLLTACNSKSESETNTTAEQNPTTETDINTGGTDDGTSSDGGGDDNATAGGTDGNTTDGTGGGSDDNTTATSTVTPTSLKLTIEKTSLNKDENTTVKVVATYADNTSEEVTDKVEWVVTPSDAVKITNSTLIALQDKATTVKAKLNSVASDAVSLNIYWEVNGHRLPPEPDPKINNSTLLGIDSNNNGVRDDVERWIYEKYDTYIPCVEKDVTYTLPNGKVIKGIVERECEDEAILYHPIVRAIAIAMQGARAAQIIIQEPEKARETREIFSKAYLCDSYIVRNKKITINGKEYKVLEKRVMREEFDGIQFNTVKRARAYGKYNFNLSGGVYRLPTDDVILQGCSQEVHQLLEDLK